eukprot:Gb_00204 [translate_table: standard]
MASAMPNIELASSFHHHYHGTRYGFNPYKHCCTRFFATVLAEDSVYTDVPVEGQPTQKSIWKTPANNSNTLCWDGLLKEALNQPGIPLDFNTHSSLLQSCTNIKALKRVHARILTTGLHQNIFLATKLVSLYATCSSMEDARLVFDKIYKRNVFTWNVLIRGYVANGLCDEVLNLYNQMQGVGIRPDNFTFSSVLKACASLSSLREGKVIHDHIVKTGFDWDVFVGNSLLAMYTKCNNIEIARQLFDEMSERDVITWNAMIAGYSQNGYANEALTLFHQMQLEDVAPTSVTTVSLLQACAHLGALQEGKMIHDFVIRCGFESDVSVQNSLVALYAKCGNIDNARWLFDKMPKRTVVSWNAIIAGYAQNGHANEALTLFHRMQLADMVPNPITMSSVLQACAQLGALQQGKWIHDDIVQRGFESDISVANSLVAMYAKCGSVEVAHQLFNKMSERNVVSWNAMIAGYAQNGHANEALTLFHQMQMADVEPNSVTMLSVLQASAHLGAFQQGKRIHDYIIRNGFQADVFVVNSLVDMYAKCGSIEFARHLFDEMPEKQVSSWNAMIAGYAQNGHADEALMLFNKMQLTDTKPDVVTLVSVLPACAHLAALQQGRLIHGYVIRSGFESDVSVENSLIDMYAKCGSVEIARQLFDKMSNRDVVSWNTMIQGYGTHGHGEDALALFTQMQQIDMKPNHITFICVLSACSHAGLVDEGWLYFNCMSQLHYITPRMEHYACMVDLLGRAGFLDEAQDFIERMPLQPGASVWGALLGACRIHCNIELGERVAERLFELVPEDAGYYVLLSNIYAAAGSWEDVEKVRTMMKDRGLKKTPGYSLIEVNNTVYTFIAGDRSHPQSDKIYAMLETLAGQMKAAGYVSNTNFVLHNVEDELKEDLLSSHSEKLAIAFGLINTIPGTSIRITKNLRICGDCHSATKFISKITMREIIVRDANRFHHFKDGLCSCGDYW